MLAEGQALLRAGARGLAFGCLTETGQLNWDANQALIELCQTYGAQSVFHRAIDVVAQPDQAIEGLIKLGCQRILTSGGAKSIEEGRDRLAHYQAQYGADIEFVMGAGLNLANAADLVAYTGIQQVHGSFKTWYQDPTTQQGPVSFAYDSRGAYEGADRDLARALGQALGKKE